MGYLGWVGYLGAGAKERERVGKRGLRKGREFGILEGVPHGLSALAGETFYLFY